MARLPRRSSITRLQQRLPARLRLPWRAARFFQGQSPQALVFNLTPRDEWLAAYAAKVAQDSSLGIPQIGQDETILIDYGGPNVAKPLHIGHLRSAIIGEALKRIARACGYRVISDIHLGDWGLQMRLGDCGAFRPASRVALFRFRFWAGERIGAAARSGYAQRGVSFCKCP